MRNPFRPAYEVDPPIRRAENSEPSQELVTNQELVADLFATWIDALRYLPLAEVLADPSLRNSNYPKER